MKTQLMVISAFVLSSFAGLGWAETGTPAAKGAPAIIQAGTPAPASIGQKVAEDAAKAAVPAELGKGVKAVEKANDASAPKVPESLQDVAQEAKPAAKPAEDAAGKGQPTPEASKAPKPAPHKAGKAPVEPGSVR